MLRPGTQWRARAKAAAAAVAEPSPAAAVVRGGSAQLVCPSRLLLLGLLGQGAKWGKEKPYYFQDTEES